MSDFELYPWLSQDFYQLTQLQRQNLLPHALLLTSQPGWGKIRLARCFAQWLLCQAPLEDKACGQCAACARFQAGTHPDFHSLQPEEGKKQIRVEHVRHLLEDLSLKSHAGGWRIFVISPADAMNDFAANALLKSLEEPPPQSLFLLLTSHVSQILPTIRSRCRFLSLHPSQDLAHHWLVQQCPQADFPLSSLASEGPLLLAEQVNQGLWQHRQEFLSALQGIAQQRGGVIALANQWYKEDILQLLQWWQQLLADLIKLASGANLEQLNESELLAGLDRQYQAPKLMALLEFWQQLALARQQFAGQANGQLLLETLLIQWVGLYQSHQ